MNAGLLKALREGAKKLRKDLKNFEGSQLKTRTGRTAKTIKVSVRKKGEGAILEIKGSGVLNIWEYKGRKAYRIPKRKPVRVKMPSGRILNISPRAPLRIPAAGPRPVLQPALKRNEGNLTRLVSEITVNKIEHLMPDKVELKK